MRHQLRKAIEAGNLSALETLVQKASTAGQPIDLNMDLTPGKNLGTLGEIVCGQGYALGYRALHWAARYGHLNIINYLLDKGANINIQNYIGNTPLHVAIYYNQTPTVALLLEHGANPNIQNLGWFIGRQTSAETPLHYAVRYATTPEDMIVLLLAHGTNPKLKNNQNQTPAQLARTLLSQPERTLQIIENPPNHTPSPHVSGTPIAPPLPSLSNPPPPSSSGSKGAPPPPPLPPATFKAPYRANAPSVASGPSSAPPPLPIPTKQTLIFSDSMLQSQRNALRPAMAPTASPLTTVRESLMQQIARATAKRRQAIENQQPFQDDDYDMQQPKK